MPRAAPPAARSLLAASGLIVLLIAQSFSASLQKSPTFDEPAHIAAGLSYVSTGSFVLNPQHPPLLKELAGLSLRAAGISWTGGVPVAGSEWDAGNAILAANGLDRVLLWARLPFILLAALLGFLIYWWGRELVGDPAALGALFLFALDPTIVAHSYLVATDVGFAAFTVLFLFALWRHIQQPDAKSLIAAGAALGLVLCTKFSAVALLPVAAVLLLAARRPVRDMLAMAAVALVVIQILYVSPSGIFQYVQGARQVNADHNPGYQVFLAGEFAHRFALYYPIAWLLKEPVAAILLLLVGLVALRGLSRNSKLWLLLPPAVIFAAYLYGADDLGVRYLIPVLVFAYLIGGLGLAWLFAGRGRRRRGSGIALCTWMAFAAIGIYPDHLSYFNEAAGCIGLDGGSRCGPRWLADSNVDWGQGLKQLKLWTDANAPGRVLRLAYFGSFPPEAYGIAAEMLDPAALARPPERGLYAISADQVARGDWPRRTAPVAIVGHAYYIFDIP